MSKHMNGEVRQVSYSAVELRIIPNDGKKNIKNAGKYALRCVPVTGDPVNESGNFFMTDKQLSQLAAGYGLGDWTVLSTIIAEGDSTFHVTARFCAEGETDPEDDTIVYTTDWWKVTDTQLEVGDAGKAFLRDVVLQLAVTSNKDAIRENRTAAAAGRVKALLAMSAGRKVEAPKSDPGADDFEEEEAELDLPPAGAKGKNKR